VEGGHGVSRWPIQSDNRAKRTANTWTQVAVSIHPPGSTWWRIGDAFTRNENHRQQWQRSIDESGQRAKAHASSGAGPYTVSALSAWDGSVLGYHGNNGYVSGHVLTSLIGVHVSRGVWSDLNACIRRVSLQCGAC
jgi:hypothetical protein